MKKGLYYRDRRTGEILKCGNFTRSFHCFINKNNIEIERGKYDVYDRVVDKKLIDDFEKSRKENPKRYVREPQIFGEIEEIMKFNTIYD